MVTLARNGLRLLLNELFEVVNFLIFKKILVIWNFVEQETVELVILGGGVHGNLQSLTKYLRQNSVFM